MHNITNGAGTSLKIPCYPCDKILFPGAQLAEGLERADTIFFQDFSIADRYGMKAVKETFENARYKKRNYKEVTELAVVLNHRGWAWYTRAEEERKQGLDTKASESEERASYYFDRFNEICDWAYNGGMTDEQAVFFHNVLD